MTKKAKEDIQKEIREIQKILTSLKLQDYKSKEDVQKLQQKLDKLYNQIEK
jgi:peptidoglycan hydrolase CwlO-like protein|tara:strand:- start:44 stop:196 length:153 start_codon:yes stop_codon:yes gene_type:complete